MRASEQRGTSRRGIGDEDVRAPWQSGAEVEAFLFSWGLAHRAEGNHHFIYRRAHMGDRDEEWIDAVVGEGEDGQVVASHNVRHIASITWKQVR